MSGGGHATSVLEAQAAGGATSSLGPHTMEVNAIGYAQAARTGLRKDGD